MTRAEPTLLGAAWRYRWLVALVTAIILGAAAAYVYLQPAVPLYRATASLVLQQSVTSDGLVTAEVADERFVATQVQIMDSPLVVAEAASLLSARGFDVDTDDVASAVQITSTTDSPVVTITVSDDAAETVVAIANAVADSYLQVSRRQATATAQSQLEQVDVQLDSVGDRIREIELELAVIARQAEIEEETVLEDWGFAQIEAGAREAIDRIPDLQQQLITETDEDEADALRLQLEDLRDRVDLLEQVQRALTAGIEPESTDLLESELSGLIARRADLQTLRDQTAIDAELAPDALALVQPAEEATLVSAGGTFRTLGIAGALGLAVGIVLAYITAITRRSFSRRDEPGLILAAPLLADIPAYRRQHSHSSLPILEVPSSAIAETYRFAASSLAVTMRARGIRTLMFNSITRDQGQTTVVVNTAIATAEYGASVLVIDCDFDNPMASQLLADETGPECGILEVLDGTCTIEEGLYDVGVGTGVQLHLLGQRPQVASSTPLLKPEGIGALIMALADRFDYVLVDAPPLLEAAYVPQIAEVVDGVVIVVQHKAPYRGAQELSSQIALVGKPIIGYIYNRSSFRKIRGLKTSFHRGASTGVRNSEPTSERQSRVKTGVTDG